MVKIIDMLIPKSNKKTRPGTKRAPRSITIHETDNLNVRANALAHARLQFNGNARQASWQYQTDDEPEVYRSIPDNEVAYAGGDGRGPGNSFSIHIEMCVNIDGDYSKTVNNTADLVRYLLNKYPSITHINVFQHNKWSGKNCPRYLRSGAKGINWNGFLKDVREGKGIATVPASNPKYETTNGSFKIGQQVRIKKTATHYATGESISAAAKGKSYTIMQRGSNRMLLKGIYSWVKTSDLEIVDNSKPSTPIKKPTRKPSSNLGLVDWMKANKMDSSYGSREKLYGSGYKGTESQNISLLNKLQNKSVSIPITKPKPVTKKNTVYLPKSAKTWRTYKLNVQPVKANSDWSLTPRAFGGLTYSILDRPYKDVVTINTGRGKRNIFVGPGTGVVIK